MRSPSRSAVAFLALLALAALLAGAWWLTSRRAPETAGLPATETAVRSPGATRTAMPSRTVTAIHSPTVTPTWGLTELLATIEMPQRDDIALFGMLREGNEPIPRIVHKTPPPTALGAVERFWVSDVGASEVTEITATLRYQNERVQMWVDVAVEAEQEALERSATLFAERIYPTNHATFGEEWLPGIDGDPRLVVLNASFSGAAGYFARANQYSNEINPYSNEREMFVMNVRVLSPGTDRYDAVLAHEFQHMIHWHQDDNEDAWVNEGLSVLAEHVNGYPFALEPATRFAAFPDLQLNTWAFDAGESSHYGASFLFLRYFMERLGREHVRDLVQEPRNGIAGFETVLARSGTGLTFQDLFTDWLAANLLNDVSLQDGRFGYPELPIQASIERTIDRYPYLGSGDVRQYAGAYIELLPERAGPLRVQFEGQPTVRLVPNTAPSGHFQWWSNRGDAGHAFLQHALDLLDVTDAALTFDLWHNIEDGWDYAYLRVSSDGGETWELLQGEHMKDHNPYGNALGQGYTGISGDGQEPEWVREMVDLSAYAGQEILLRFDYVTDETLNHVGLCLDNLRIEAIGFADDVEGGEGAWQAEGFIRHDNRLPQGYLVQVVTLGTETRIERLPVAENGTGEWLIEGFGQEVERAILIVSAIAPSTTEPAHYRLRLEQLP
ncbi:MAG: hypothetical protein ACYC5M_07820 [Anaerolineae bacterium]